jgi:sugar phosphate isomerase/epimerase
MPRVVTLATGPFADLGLEEVAQKAAEWGYQGLELACWGDHLETQRALAEADYCPAKLALLERQELRLLAVAAHPIGQAVCDRPDARHRRLLPDYVWGDGDPAGVQARAAEELKAVARAAQKLGVALVTGCTGSPNTPLLFDYPPAPRELLVEGFREFARQWRPILDVFKECGLRFGLAVQPGQIAFDLHTAEMALDALDGREEFGFTVDPGQLHWQGVDPAEFVRRFADRVFQVHVRDVAVTLNGRNGILNAHLRPGDPRRGWDFRSPGHGSVDWSGFLRALNAAGYEGPLTVVWEDPGMDREYGAADACQFVKRLDFAPARGNFDNAFSE